MVCLLTLLIIPLRPRDRLRGGTPSLNVRGSVWKLRERISNSRPGGIGFSHSDAAVMSLIVQITPTLNIYTFS